MTTPDAGQAKPSSQNTRLIEDLRDPENVPWGRLIESCEAAADEIERLRAVEREMDELAALVKEHGL